MPRSDVWREGVGQGEYEGRGGEEVETGGRGRESEGREGVPRCDVWGEGEGDRCPGLMSMREGVPCHVTYHMMYVMYLLPNP